MYFFSEKHLKNNNNYILKHRLSNYILKHRLSREEKRDWLKNIYIEREELIDVDGSYFTINILLKCFFYLHLKKKNWI